MKPWWYLLDDPFIVAMEWLALGPVLDFKVADVLATSGNAISVPSFVAAAAPVVAFLTMAFGSNLPA